MGKTSIEWTDVSWPVLNGCRRASYGCQNCYAEQLSATRLRNHPKYRGLAVYQENGPRWTGDTRLWSKDITMPLKLRTASKIFVCDMGDLFYEGNSDDQIDQVFGVMWACMFLGRNALPGHIFQVLTKRSKRMLDYVASDRRKQIAYWAVHHGGGLDPDGIHDQVMFSKLPHPRIWFGVSAEDQDWANLRWKHLQRIYAPVRFLSLEPLLGPVTMRDWYMLPDWVIVGGESGPRARPYDVGWAKNLITEGIDLEIPIFHKQLGANPYGPEAPDRNEIRLPFKLKHSKGANMSEWEEHLRVREFPRVQP